MNLTGLSKLINSEQLTEEYLQQKSILKIFTNCIHCSSTQVLRIRRGYIKCYSCKKEWNVKKFSIIENMRISPAKFLLAIKCFSLNLTLTVCARECELDFQTTKKVYSLIRKSISPIEGTVPETTGEFRLSIRYNDGSQLFTGHLVNEEDDSEAIAIINLRRTKRKDGSFTFQIINWSLISDLPKPITGRTSILIKQIMHQLDQIRDKSPSECILNIGEVLFRLLIPVKK